MASFRRKRKFADIEEGSSSGSIEAHPAPKRAKLGIKRTFARKRRDRSRAKHLHKKATVPIIDNGDDSDEIYSPSEDTKKRRKSKKSTPKSSPTKSRSPIKKNSINRGNQSDRKSTKTASVKKVQSTLDFPVIKEALHKINKCGPTQCHDCGMLYYPGRQEDDELHFKFHRSFMNRFDNGFNPKILGPFTVWNHQQIVLNAPYYQRGGRGTKKYKQLKIGLDSKSLEEYKDGEIMDDEQGNDRILSLKYDEFIALKSKNPDILSVVDMMDRDLGYFTTTQMKNGEDLKVDEKNTNDHDDAVVHSLEENQSLFCFVEKTGHKIVGCIVCEPKSFAYFIKTREKGGGDMDNVEREEVKQKCFVGVVKVWVHQAFRRLNIASVLLDCIRYNFIYGTTIEKRYVAFNQPTRMGQFFAVKYCETKQILVY